MKKAPQAGPFQKQHLTARYADFFGAAFFAATFLAGARVAGLAALATVPFTAAFDFTECGRALPWLPA